MTWVFVTIIAYFFHALNAIVDKFLLSERIPRPSNYAFYVGIFGLLSLFLIPFGDFFIPSPVQLVKAFISGGAFTFALFLFFIAMKHNEASRVSTMIGTFSPIFVLILSYFFLGSGLGERELLAFVILIFGGVLISFKKSQALHGSGNGAYMAAIAVFASLIFAMSYVSAKAVFNDLPFINGFIWTRLGSFAASLVFLIPKETRNSILNLSKIAGGKTAVLFLLNKIFGALGFFLISYAISLGNVSIINAMQGVEYALIFVLAVFLSSKYPFILEEEISRKILMQKIFAILLISLGLFILA